MRPDCKMNFDGDKVFLKEKHISKHRISYYWTRISAWIFEGEAHRIYINWFSVL